MSAGVETDLTQKEDIFSTRMGRLEGADTFKEWGRNLRGLYFCVCLCVYKPLFLCKVGSKVICQE